MSSCHGHSRAPPQERSPGAAARASVAEFEPMARQLTAWLLPGVRSCCCPWHKAGEASPLARARAACFERLPGKLAIRAARPPTNSHPVPNQLSAVPDQLSARPQPALSPSSTSSLPVPDQSLSRPTLICLHPALTGVSMFDRYLNV